jgi:VWFA-related protein
MRLSGRRVILPLLVVTLTLTGEARQQPRQPQTQAQQRPVFRGGTHFVRVDAYPIQDGKIVEGLEAEDFEILEDGKPQKIESFDFLQFDTFTPVASRRDPVSQRDSFDKAADPRYRVFVIVVEVKSEGIGFIQKPLVQFLDRVLGQNDLFGLLTTNQSAKDLILGQSTGGAEAVVQDLWRSRYMDRDDADELDACGEVGQTIKRRFRLDETYVSLESLVQQLGSLRQERKNVIFVANDLARLKPDPKILERRGPMLPKTGITNGRLGTGDHAGPAGNDLYCAGEAQRLAQIDFDFRYRELLREARKQNVTFYAITPAGLQAPTTVGGQDRVRTANDNLLSLATETDGIAIVDTNDLSGGMRKIADDLAAYYVLGYYTTNTNFDGGVRNIKVRYKANGNPIRARRQYRAPTKEEIAALAAGAPAASASPAGAAPPSPREVALTILDRASRPFAGYVAAAGRKLTVVAELSAASIQSGRWKDGADVEVTSVTENGDAIATARGKIEPGSFSTAVPLAVTGAWPARVTIRLRGSDAANVDDWVKLTPPSATLVGEPLAYRSASRSATRPVAGFEFARNERIRVEWPVLRPLDRREVRLLDHTGKALPVELPLSEDPARASVVVDMSLSGLPHGDYLIELTAGAGAVVEHSLIAVRIR